MQLSAFNGIIFVPKHVSSSPAVPSFHHPLRLGNSLRMTCSKGGKDATMDDENDSLEIYSMGGKSCNLNDFREGN